MAKESRIWILDKESQYHNIHAVPGLIARPEVDEEVEFFVLIPQTVDNLFEVTDQVMTSLTQLAINLGGILTENQLEPNPVAKVTISPKGVASVFYDDFGNPALDSRIKQQLTYAGFRFS